MSKEDLSMESSIDSDDVEDVNVEEDTISITEAADMEYKYFAITSQPRSRTSLQRMNEPAIVGFAGLDNQMSNLSSIIMRPSTNETKNSCIKEFEIVEEINRKLLFRVVPSYPDSYCHFVSPLGINLYTSDDVEFSKPILQCEINSSNFSLSQTSKFYCPLGHTIGHGIYNKTGWFMGHDSFEIEDSQGNVSFFSDARCSIGAQNPIPEFEITTEDMLSLGRITIKYYKSNSGQGVNAEMTLRWFENDETAQRKALGVAFLVFAYSIVAAKYKPPERFILSPPRKEPELLIDGRKFSLLEVDSSPDYSDEDKLL